MLLNHLLFSHFLLIITVYSFFLFFLITTAFIQILNLLVVNLNSFLHTPTFLGWSNHHIRFCKELPEGLVKNGFDVAKAPTRNKFLHKLKGKVLSPQAIICRTPSDLCVPVFPLMQQIHDLLLSPLSSFQGQ